jgi:hypothetical protein
MWPLPFGMQLQKPQMLTLIPVNVSYKNEAIILKKRGIVFLGRFITFLRKNSASSPHSIDVFANVK